MGTKNDQEILKSNRQNRTEIYRLGQNKDKGKQCAERRNLTNRTKKSNQGSWLQRLRGKNKEKRLGKDVVFITKRTIHQHTQSTGVLLRKEVDLRLLHGVAYGHSWFGKWGYRFVGALVWKNTTGRVLHVFFLDDITANFREKKANLNIGDIVRCYRDMSEIQLTTLLYLLRFMLTIKSRAPPIRIPIGKIKAPSVVLPSMKAYGTRACQHTQVKQCPKVASLGVC